MAGVQGRGAEIHYAPLRIITIIAIIVIIAIQCRTVMPEHRITSVELHSKLGATIDRAIAEPVIVTKHGRDHLVLLSAERYAAMLAVSDGVQSPVAEASRRKLARTR